MNLEAIEQKCLAYLMQVSRPVIPVTQLLRYLHRDTEFADMSERELVDFLRKHELFTVLDPIGLASDPEGASALEAAGISMGTSVMLETRVPTKRQLAEMMNEQLDTILSSLETAAAEAQDAGNEQRYELIATLYERTQQLQERLRSFNGG